MSSYKFRTIEEMEAAYYGVGNSAQFLVKADAPLTTSTTGVYNPVFGAYAWAQLNLEANAFGVLPKYPWLRSGIRFITARPTLTTTNANTVLGGTSEGGAIAETAKPTLAEFSTKPKTVQLPFEVTEVMEFLATESQDDIWGGLGSLRLFNAVQHKEFINQMLLADVEKPAADAGANYTGTKDFETLDRIVSADAEEDQLGGSFTSFYDPYDGSSIDRDSGTTFDSQVVSASGTIGTNGVLTDERIREIFRRLHKNSGKYPTVIISGEEAYQEVQGIYTPAVRYGGNYGEGTVQIDVNGIQTFQGTGVGIHVDTLYGVPVIPAKDAPKNADDASEVGRMLFLDTSDPEGFGYPRVGIMVAKPTQYFEASRNTAGYPFVNGKFNERALYRTMGEVICRHYPSQGKIRDIKQ